MPEAEHTGTTLLPIGPEARILSLGLSLPQGDLLSRGNYYCRGRSPPPGASLKTYYIIAARCTQREKKEERVGNTICTEVQRP
jgi:hypothetical protein